MFAAWPPTAVERMGKIDILVNNAGANVPQAIDQIRDEDWDRLVELNLTSCMALTRALVPGMKERRWGRVIHISSIMGLASTAGRNAYSATKAALLGLARASALDLGAFNITVNCIAPGPVCHRDADVDPQRGAAGRSGRPHGAEPLGHSRRSWPVRPSCWPARRAATSRGPCWWSTAGRWRRCFDARADMQVTLRLRTSCCLSLGLNLTT